MTTRLALFCDKIIEACWLAALVIAPLFFNFHSSTVFDPDKSCVVRSLVLVMFLAFIIRILEGGLQANLRKRLRHPIMITAVALALSYLLSMFLSVTPHNSWWGSFARLQGTYTLLSYVVIFLVTALSLRDQQQIKRMITTIVLVSLPITVYGLFQRFHLDPLPWDTDFSSRIASTLGNPIFLGSYLIMVMPLTLAQLILHVVSKANLSIKSESRRWAIAIFYGLLFMLQCVALVLTQSRGPVVGLAVGMFVFIIFVLLMAKRRYLVLGVYGLALAGIIFLVVFNIPQGPLESLKDTPYLGRLGKVFETTGGSGKIRLLMWEGVLNMVKNNPARAVVGYGPEILFIPIHKYAPAELVRYEGRIAFPDRAHNEFFDLLAGTGFIGLAFYLILIFLIGFYTLRWLGFIRTLEDTYLYTGLNLLGLILGLLIPWLLQGNLVFIGIGVPMGLVFGIIIYLLIRTLSVRDNTIDLVSFIIPIALFSGLLAHFIEIQFGIALTGARTYFWILVAMLFFYLVSPVKTGEKQETRNKIPWSGIMAMILIVSVLIYDLTTTSTLSSLLGNRKMIMLFVAFIVVWLVSGVVIVSGVRRWVLYLAVSGIGGIIFVLMLMLGLPPMSEPCNAIVVFYIWLLIWILVTAYLLFKNENKGEMLRWGNSIVYIILVVGIGATIIWTNLNPLRANVIAKVGSGFEGRGNWARALEFYDRAIDWAADPTYYYASVARVYLERYQREPDDKKKAEWSKKCLEYLNKSLEYDPYSPTRQANMARFYRSLARITPAGPERDKLLGEVEKHYQKATELSPHDPELMNEWGEAYHEVKDYPKAIERYHASIEADKTFAESYAHLGDTYLETNNIPEAVKWYNQAAQYYLDRHLPNIREPNQVLIFTRTHQKLIEYDKDNYLGYYNLARFYYGRGNVKEAQDLARQALDKNPPSEVQQHLHQILR